MYSLTPREGERRQVFHVLTRRNITEPTRMVCKTYDEPSAIHAADRFFALNPDHYVEVSRTMERVEL